MKIEIINTSSEVVPLPGGRRLGPFETADVERAWLHKHSSHVLKTPEGYDEMVANLERKHLIAHVKKRRSLTGEELSAQGTDDELRAQLFLGREPEAGEAA